MKIEKKIKHKEIEICLICKKEIETTVHDWAVIVDYEADEQVGKAFYHRDCLRDLLKGKAKIIKEQFRDRLNGAIKNISKSLNQSIPI